MTKTREQKTDEQSKDQDSNYRKLRKAFLFVKQNVSVKRNTFGLARTALSENYWIEKLDPKHREREYLWKNLTKWKKDKDCKEDFFTWLDAQEAKAPESKSGPNRHNSLAYHSRDADRKNCLVKFKGGIMYIHEGIPQDTLKCKGKKPGVVENRRR